MTTEKLLEMGKITQAFGIKGWLKVYSFTEYREDILHYSPWILGKGNQRKIVDVLAGQRQGHAVIAQVSGVEDRTQAESLIGWSIHIAAEQLPKPDAGEYYWSDLIGLQVINQQGVILGKVTGLMETGANDVLLVAGERDRAIPFLQGQVINDINLTTGMMQVDWDADF